MTIDEHKKECIEEMVELLKTDTESAHGRADDILCEFLTLLGHSDLVDAWEEIDKWYD